MTIRKHPAVVRNAASPPANEATVAVGKVLVACSSKLEEVGMGKKVCLQYERVLTTTTFILILTSCICFHL